MNKKIALQVLMLFSIVLISSLFYAKYLKKNNKESREKLTVKNQKKIKIVQLIILMISTTSLQM